MKRLPPWFAAVAMALVVHSSRLSAQCEQFWAGGGSEPLLHGPAACSVVWDPDGAGPAPAVLVIGGRNLWAGSSALDERVMTWDGTRWEALGTGLPSPGVAVDLLIVWNGQLVASSTQSSQSDGFIAVWDGATWQELVGGPAAVESLGVWNGQLVVGGVTVVGGSLYPLLRLWNGTTWLALPSPPSLAVPSAIQSYQGNLYIGGSLDSPNVGALERWNGTSWAPSILTDDMIACLAVRASIVAGGPETLYAGGLFSSIGSSVTGHVAATTGGTSPAWSGVGSGWPSWGCRQLRARNQSLGTVELVGLANDSTARRSVAGGPWIPMGSESLSSVIYFQGAWHATQSSNGSACLRFDGTNWMPVRGAGLDAEVRSLAPLGNDLVLGGTFTTYGSLTLNRIAHWDGVTIQALGSGITGSSVDALTTLANGDVVAGGAFSAAGGITANNIARWDGNAWASLGAGTNQQVLAMCRLPNGDLIAGGRFTTAGGVPCSRIARWDGNSWSPLGSGLNGDVHALAVRADGRLFAAGSFTFAGAAPCNRVAQWNGFTWLQLGSGTNDDVFGLTARPNGDVVAVGSFTAAGGVAADRCASWTGNSWVAMGTSSADPSPVRAAVTLPGGDVVVGHGFHAPNDNPDEGLARWNGNSWSGIEGGLSSGLSSSVVVRSLTLGANGDLLIGGSFAKSSTTTARNLARLAPTCPALATPYGTGCSSTAGPLVLTADTPPWRGASFRTTTTGIAPGSLALGVMGFTSTSLPLASLLLEGQPGCTLLTSVEILLPIVPTAGAAQSTLALPNAPSLVGAGFFHQTIPLEFGASGAIAAVRASNGLALVIGAL